MKKIGPHIKKYVLRGLLALIPIMLTVFAIYFLYSAIDKRVVNLFYNYTGVKFPGLGLLFVLIVLYIVGLVASNVMGKQVFHLFERFTNKIPLIKTTYQVGKQISSTLSLPERQVFKKAVLVEYLKSGMYTIGFVTGTIVDHSHNNEHLLKVYIPTPPNPTSGTMVIVREEQTRNPGWTVEEAMKAVISGGIIGPEELD